MTTLKAWFKDNVEAEITYRQYINHSKRHLLALVFQNEKGSAIGTNYGNQYAIFSKGRLRKKAGAKVKGVPFDNTAKFKKKVRLISIER